MDSDLKLDPQKVLDAIENCGVCDQQVMLEYAHDAIMQMMTDYVPVVRCKDCKFYEHCKSSRAFKIIPNGDWFCADGERKGGDTE